MKEKAFLQVEKTEKQRALPSPDRTAERQPSTHPASGAREAGQYVSGRGQPTAAAVRALQRAVGNARVQRALGNQTETDDETDPGLAKELARERDSGQLLPAHVQEQMERAFGDGHDFSGVRVHTTPKANALNRRLRARAFTAGQDIFFREGEFAPQTASGKKLLAHELAHVVQQSQGVVDSTSSSGDRVVVGEQGDAFEQAADRVAEAVASAPTPSTAHAATSIQQQVEPEEEEEELLQAQFEEEEEEYLQAQFEEEEEPLQAQFKEEEDKSSQA